MGADSLFDLPTWREPQAICNLATPIVVARAGAAAPDYSRLEGIVSAGRIAEITRLSVEMPAIGLSSREIRQRVAAGRSIRYRTPRAVEKYIETHGLYRPHEVPD
jgi:nicotinate-nucleotide adenylyltransferase